MLTVATYKINRLYYSNCLWFLPPLLEFLLSGSAFEVQQIRRGPSICMCKEGCTGNLSSHSAHTHTRATNYYFGDANLDRSHETVVCCSCTFWSLCTEAMLELDTQFHKVKVAGKQ